MTAQGVDVNAPYRMLPDSADPERITAHGANGVLEISIPKRPETTPRRIQVGVTTDGSSDSTTRQ